MSGYIYEGRPIRFSIEIYPDFVPAVGGISQREFYFDPKAAAGAWKAQLEFIRSEFGGSLPPSRPRPAPISYGHLSCIGCELNYPENGEPNVVPAVSSIDEAIEYLKKRRGIDFYSQPIWKHYVRTAEILDEAFPEFAPTWGGLGGEGPVTSAALFRGEDFYYDLMDEPEKCAEFLSLMTESIIDYQHAMNRFSGRPEINPQSAGLADDLASMLPPSMWETHVLPFWRAYYEGCAAPGARRWLHCEALKPSQLGFVEKAGVTFYQPSVAPELSLKDMRTLTIPFDWLLYAYRVVDMTGEEISAWIADSLAYGPAELRTQFGRYAYESGKLGKIHDWLDAAEKYAVK